MKEVILEEQLFILHQLTSQEIAELLLSHSTDINEKDKFKT